MEDKHTGHSSDCQNMSVTTQVHNRVMTSTQTLTTNVGVQCLTPGGCDGTQPPTILSSDLSELTSKFENENLIKVDSMLAEPCQYLEEVSVFGVDENGETNHSDYVDGSVELHEAGPLFKAEEPDQTEEAAGQPAGANDGTLKEDSLLGDGGSKDAKVNILDSAPFLMNEAGVIFQCFPISEKEVFLVSLEDETLLMNEPLTEEQLPMVTEATPEIEMGNFEEASGEHNENIIDGKLEDSQFPQIESTSRLGIDAEVCSDIPSTTLITSSQSNFEENNDFQDSELPAEVSLSEMTLESINHRDSALSVSGNTADNGITTRKKRKALSPLKDDEHAQAGPEITHATIYATVPRRIKKWPAENEEVPSELYKCTVCSETLPTSGTLRHHLVSKHNQSNIDSFMCFLCKQECWSSSQQEWHLRIQHGIKNKSLACLVCGTQFSTPTECRAHVRKHPLNLACPSCPKKFAAQHQLFEHVKQHLEVIQPYGCQECENRFTSPRVLETHMWRHRSQNCPKESCEYTAEDESWLVHHLQEHHKYTTQSIRSLTISRNSAEYKMDILLSKYVQIQTSVMKSVPPCSSKTCESQDQSPSFEEDMRSDDGTSLIVDKDAAELDTKRGADMPSTVLKDMMEAVIAVEEDDKKAIKREEEILRKVFDGGTSQHRCGLCNTYHASQEDLAAHKAEHNQVIECIKCQKSFSSVKQLKRHMTVHTSNKDGHLKQLEKDKVLSDHQCLVCGKECGSESALSRHSSVHMRSEGRHQCKVCSRRVRTRSQLTEHMSRVHKINCDSKRIQCPMCDRRFVSNAHLNSHLITHGETEPLYSCKICHRNYLRPRSLQRHMISHEQTYACNTCNESFPSARRLAFHARGHDPSYKSKVQCPQCSLTFSYKSQLEIHLRTHTGEKPYVCETCGKCFKRLQQCKVHHKAVHGSEKHPCLECGKPFGDKTNMLRHRLKIHYHLKRWVCGVCAQSFAYSKDFRNHLKKHHDIEFRLDITSKKCMSEVYVIPELGTREINPNTRAAIEYFCEMERQKVKQILSGIIPDVVPTEKASIGSTNDANDPDDPAPLSETVSTRSVFIPSAPIGVSNVDGNRQLQSGIQSSSSFQPLTNGEVQGLVPLQIAGVKCAECGIDVTAPQQCGVCGVMVCSQAHMDIHSASVHQVLFQCSVCGLHYSSQSGCIAHVLSNHSSCLAYQGNSATYLPPSQILQNNTSSAATQLCLPPVHSQTNSQCVLQVAGGSSQLPVVVAPSAINVASPQFASTGYLLQYGNLVSGVPSGISVTQQATSVEAVSNVGKPTMYAMSNVFTSQQSSATQTQASSALVLKKSDPHQSTSLCTVTVPADNTGNPSISSESNGVLTFATKPAANILPAFTPHTDNTSEVSSIIVGSTEFQKQDNSTSVLLVDSVPVPDLSDEVASAIPSQKLNAKINVCHQASSSVASALLTLAETPQEDQTSVLVENDTPEGEADQVLSFSLVGDVPFLQDKKDTIGSGENSGILQSIPEVSSISKEEQIQEPSLSSPENLQMMESSADVKQPQEISVEIIQPQVIRAKSDSKSLKASPKKPITRVRRKRIIGLAKNEAYECKTCSKSFSSNAQLEKHQTIHGIRRFKCQICDKAFSEKYNLKIHTLTHTQERPHECNLCQKSFRYARDLTEHKRTHEGTRPHVCDVCQKTFVRKRDFVRHRREQHNNKGYQCKVCGLYFKRLHYLKEVHMRIHHPLLIEASEEGRTKDNGSSKTENRQSHICKICGKTFARARYLTSHLRVHSKRADYVRCPMCPRMFTSEQTLKVHKEAFHDHEPSLQDNSSAGADAEHIISQGDGIITHFHQSQTENIIISEVRDMTESPQSSLASSSRACATQLPSKASKLEIFSSVNSPTSVQASYSNALVRNDLVTEGSLQSVRMGHFNIHIDNVDSINYLSPSYTS